jgi:hypothetical protein
MGLEKALTSKSTSPLLYISRMVSSSSIATIKYLFVSITLFYINFIKFNYEYTGRSGFV